MCCNFYSPFYLPGTGGYSVYYRVVTEAGDVWPSEHDPS